MKRYTPLFALTILLTGCADYHLTVADEAYDMLAFEEAAKHYEKALKRIEDRDATVRLAECYRLQNELDSAEHWYDRAEVFGALETEEHLYYAQVLMGKNDLIRAREHLVHVLKADPNNDHAVDLMFSCLGYPGFYIDTTLFTFEEVELPEMTAAFSATPYEDGIMFIGEKKATLKKENPWNGMSFLDIYTTKGFADGSYSEAVPLPSGVNGKYHEGPAVVAPGDSVMYFTRSNYSQNKLETDTTETVHIQIFKADRNEEGLWGNAQPMSFNSPDYSTGHPALSADGNTMYFISDMEGGLGGTDIYVTHLKNGEWSTPENLGEGINSQGDEMFPTMHLDTLYFSSTAHQNMGGLDVFWSEKKNGQWTAADNMRYPVNTEYDDFGMVFDPDGRTGYLSSTRGEQDQLYRFQRFDPKFSVEGTVTNKLNAEPIAAEVVLVDLATGKRSTVMADADGKFRFALEPNKDYELISLFDDEKETRRLSTVGQRFSKVFDEDVALELPLEELNITDLQQGLPMVVDDIYYDFDKYYIRPDAEPSLMQLVELFTKNPDMKFELSAHTDSRASNGYNMWLSKKRAQAAVDFLVSKGVDKHMIKARGYGEKRLVNHCKDGVACTREQHQENRRTEIKIIGGSPSLVVEP